MPGGQSPSFELTATGLGKETTFAAVAAPTVWLPCTDISPDFKNNMIARTGARQRRSQSYPVTGQYEGGVSFTTEATPDVLGALLALTMGAESVVANPGNPSSGSPTLGYDHIYNFGPTLGSFTLQEYRVTDTMNYAGNMVSQFRLSAAPGQLLTAQISTQACRDNQTTSPNTPAFGILEPFRFEDPGNTVSVNGTVGAFDIKAFDLQISTGIMAADYVFGGGRTASKFNLGQAQVSGSATIKFNDPALQKLFYGNSTATSPQSAITPIALEFYFRGKDMINANVPYGLKFRLPKCFPQGAPVAGRAGGVLEQVLSFSAGESTPGAADDIVATLTNAASSPF